MVEPLDALPTGGQTLTELNGTVLAERYELGEILGAGGMGAVFQGKDLRLGRSVAIKVIRPGLARDSEYTKRFLREAQTASMVRHRNVVVILDYGTTEGGLVYSVMEFLIGQDLEALLRGQPEQRLPWQQACSLLQQVASGLRAAHNRGVIHRDIKPANCFLTQEDDEPVVKLVDFGIAKLDGSTQTQQLTSTGSVLGTPSYTAPEIVLRGGVASPRSDIYSLGVVAFRMLAGGLPFTGATAFEVMHHACIKPTPLIRERVADVPLAVEQLVLEMLAKEPDDRPADMAAVRQRLQALCLGNAERITPSPSSTVAVGMPRASVEVPSVAPRDNPGDGSSPSVDASAAVLDAGSIDSVPQRDQPLAVSRSGTMVTPTKTMVTLAQRGDRTLAGPPRGYGEAVTSSTVEVQPSSRWKRAWLVGVGFVALMLGGVAVGLSWGDSNSERHGDAADNDTTNASTAVVPANKAVVPPSDPGTEMRGPSEEGDVVSGTTPAHQDLQPSPEPSTPDVPASRAELPAVDPSESAAALPSETEPSVDADPGSAAAATAPRAQPARSAPKGPPADAVLKKRLARRIKSKCSDEIASQRVTVLFFVTSGGQIDSLTATPKNAAGDCAKRQVAGTKFRTREGDETAIKIVVN